MRINFIHIRNIRGKLIQSDFSTRPIYTLFFLVLILLSQPVISQNSYINICEHGADNTGKQNSSLIINRLIDSLNNNNGGTIYFPSGNYYCGPIFMKSNITLHTDAGAIINFSDNFSDYLPMVVSQWEGVRLKTFASQIYAIDAQNISITGKGHFEGHGKKWWDYWFDISRNEKVESEWQKIFIEENKELLSRNKYISRMKNFLRPPMVLFYNCKDILIEGVSFSNPPFWTLVPVYCDNVTISKVKIYNPGDSPNTDGIDPCSCTNVHISDCHISVGDDCIVLKSGRDEDGREAARPTENVTITNCTMLNGHGGVVLGSEMSGDIRRVTISNCVFEGTDRGIRFKTMRGRGGVIEDVRVNNIVMHDIVKEGIILNMRYQKTDIEPISERTPSLRDIYISGVSISGAKKGIAIYGLEERSVDQISFSDIFIESEKGIDVQYAKNLLFDNISIETPSDKPIQFDKCSDITFSGLRTFKPQSNSTLFTLKECKQFIITGCYGNEKLDTFMNYDDKCDRIYLTNNIISNYKKIIEGTDPAKVILRNNIE